MREVTDTNYLMFPELKEYLSKPYNCVVLTDLVIMETLRIGDLESVCRQLEPLTQHPKQVIVLKTTHAVAGLRRRRRRGLQRRRVHRVQTQGFAAWCEKLDLARKGDKELVKQFVAKCERASADLADLAMGQETFAANLAEHAKHYSEAELKILRKNEPITPELLKKIKGHIVDLAGALFDAHPSFKKRPAVKHLPNAFVFRYAISGYVVALRRIKEGGANEASAEKIRNDLIDAMIVAHATYFDGSRARIKKQKRYTKRHASCSSTSMTRSRRLRETHQPLKEPWSSRKRTLQATFRFESARICRS
ncbi:hypothetical protein XH89_15830 [Bradyrhizobium sp. CCBAU 53340]|uniref:hypothetical protein n=1 Tax=Bradyrhizobium sp. CCBAU 53340 TaxID=1325112 RepID=UPI00188BC525|nr:hypothetical protein [Bradyrhizobium sp. CCBAU 53340]QOZ44780.1 hypothetical protein XH89_15830 [Bradyrhizobium sp. CCBAU 53340]